MLPTLQIVEAHGTKVIQIFFHNNLARERETYSVIRCVPISNQDGEIVGRIIERDRDKRPAKDSNPAESTSSLVESE